MKPPKAREGDRWIVAEYRFRRPAVGPFDSEADARGYMAVSMADARGWHVIPLREPVLDLATSDDTLGPWPT